MIRQGGNGLGTVIAVVILAAVNVYAINIWSTTNKERSPAKNLKRVTEQIKDAAGKAIEPRNSPAASVMLWAGLPQETPAFSFDSEPLELDPLDSPA